MSLLGKARYLRTIDPETTDRMIGDFEILQTGEWVHIDVPYISHIWGALYVGGVDYDQYLPEHFRNVIQLYDETYEIEHEPVGVWRFDIKDSRTQDLSGIDDIARVTINAMKLGDTLVHCQAGMNRSCLVASRVLQMNGFTPQESVDMLREKRMPWALSNPAFERWTLETPVLGGGEEA